MLLGGSCIKAPQASAVTSEHPQSLMMQMRLFMSCLHTQRNGNAFDVCAAPSAANKNKKDSLCV